MEFSKLEGPPRAHPVQPFRNGPCRDRGPVVRGQLSRQLSRHCSLPGSSWLSLPVPEPSEPEQSPKKPMSSSEPILDIKGDTAEALPALEDAAEPRASPGRRQEPAEPIPGRAAQPEGKEPSPSGSPPWPEAPEESPARPSTLDLGSALQRLEELKPAGQRRGSDRAALGDSGVEATMGTATTMQRGAPGPAVGAGQVHRGVPQDPDPGRLSQQEAAVAERAAEEVPAL
ncbi:unnamed protein product, partial [Coccothraustes coccothraustes]